MAARPLQPSEYEIQREVEVLRDLRRRSTTPGALTIDPDLPNQSSPSSPTSQYWTSKSPVLSPSARDSSSPSSPGQGSTSSNDHHATGGSRTPDTQTTTDDPLHLFWVPASLHPEIAPAEFRAFLKEHARSPGDESDSIALSSSASLSSSPSLGRKRSMLSRQYRPKENDGVEEESVLPVQRNRSLSYRNNTGPQLTISDLQRLEELAEESDDPSILRNVLRRSLSLNLSPSAIDMSDDLPDMGDEADAPIIVPPPGQILRRAARTKIRKPGLPGDGGGHRFGSSRRGGSAKATQAPAEPRSSSDISSSDHGESEPNYVNLRRPTLSDEGAQPRPESYSEEASIYEAYARDDDEEVAYTPIQVSATPPPPEPPSQEESVSLLAEELPRIPIEVIPVQPQPPTPFIHQPQPQRLAIPQPSQEPILRTPSPPESTPERLMPVPTPVAHVKLPPQSRKDKEKDKKGIFGKWGGDKGSRKNHKDKDRDSRGTAEKEKESGFFGSLFGGKKKHESEYHSSITGGTSGREAAQALLGASKSSKSYVPPTSPGLAPGIGGNPYARYPIHVERAIYRLSHIKLANPRRPLYEQVLISNLMFWYLGVINKAQSPSPSPTQLATNGGQGTVGLDSAENEQEQKEKEQRENELKEKAEKERSEREQRERELELRKKESGRRGSLTKTSSGGPSSGRRAEMPIKGPQYEMQHRVIEQEYGGFSAQPPRSPTSSVSVSNGSPQSYPRLQQPGTYPNSPQKLVQSQAQVQLDQHYHQIPAENSSYRPALPPGAMPPIDQSTWISPPSPQHMHAPMNSPPDSTSSRRSRSPPPHIRQSNYPTPQNQLMQLHGQNTSQESLGDRSGGHRGPTRSLSATASSSSPTPAVNGMLRKGNSAHAAISPYDRRPHTSEGRSPSGEEEDVPLAVWQQQRRR